MAGEITNVKLYYGDTLEKIARRHFTTIDAILELNPNIKNPDLIVVGDTLKVPAIILDAEEENYTANVDSIVVTASPAPDKQTDKGEDNKSVTAKNNEEDSGWKSALLFGSGILTGAALTYAYMRKGDIAAGLKMISAKVKNLFKHAPKTAQSTEEAKNAVMKFETAMNQPANYKAVTDDLLPKVPVNQEIRQKELDTVFTALSADAEKSLRRVKKQLSKPTDYKKVIESQISHAPTKSEHNKRLRELREAYNGTKIPKYKKGRKYATLKKKIIEQKRQAKLKQNMQKQREEYLHSIGLGTAKPSQSTGITWKKYLEERGFNYTPKVSGAVEADIRAAQIIAENAKKQQNQISQFVSTSTNPNLKFQYLIA